MKNCRPANNFRKNRGKLKYKQKKAVIQKTKQKLGAIELDEYEHEAGSAPPKTNPFSTSKIYKFGERGSGCKVEGEPQDFSALKNACLKQKILFEDPQFPAQNSSLFRKGSPSKAIQWKRPPELVKSPQFVVDGFSRFDVKQGDLSNCWFLSAIANITMYKNIFSRIVPQDQNFKSSYAGIFHFVFWQYGRWIDIVIDDRLPVVNGKLRFLHSTEQDEFWTALLEKAYAKVKGSYEALNLGNILEALTDFTGGISEQIKLDKKSATSNLYQIMLKSFQRGSLMGCSTIPHPQHGEFVTPQGIVKGHAYSITSVKLCKITTKKGSDKVQLIRVRNPWGNEVEWNGPFSDKSSEWQLISDKTKKELGLTFESDGEFWIPFENFVKEFDEVQICNLKFDSLSQEEFKKRKNWDINIFEGEWVKGVTAGGCRNFTKFHHNPQYRIHLTQRGANDKEVCTMIIFLLIKFKRKRSNPKKTAIGFSLYKLPNEELPAPLPPKFFGKEDVYADSKYATLRQITSRFKVSPGIYCIIPTTYAENDEGEFIMQVYTDEKCAMCEYDQNIQIGRTASKGKQIQYKAVFGSKAKSEEDFERTREFFLKVAGEDKEIDWMELKGVLDYAMKKELGEDIEFSKDICRSMIAMMDTDYSGKLDFYEFEILWNDIRNWQSVFKIYTDEECENVLSGYDLRKAFNSVGYKVNNHILNILVHRYGNREGNFAFDDFIMCAVKLKTMFDIFKMNEEENKETATFTLKEWVRNVVYS